jgi:hypothetical protein
MTDILFNTQQAVHAALSQSASVQAVLGPAPRLYDHAPSDATFPYVVFGPLSVAPNDAKNATGFEQILTFNIWSRYRGGKETRETFHALYDTLHRSALTIEAQTFVSCEFHSADFDLDPDGLTYHAAVRFTVLTQSL